MVCHNMKQIPRIFHFPWPARVGVIVIVEIKTQRKNFIEFSLFMTFMRFFSCIPSTLFSIGKGGSKKFCENKISMSMFFSITFKNFCSWMSQRHYKQEFLMWNKLQHLKKCIQENITKNISCQLFCFVFAF